MTERLADVSARIEGVRQLGSIVNAIRGVAAARAQQARGQLGAVDAYSATIARAIAQALDLAPTPRVDGRPRAVRPALVLFCAEQGFAGAFSERVLDAAGGDLATSELYLIGARGVSVAAERGVAAQWTSAAPSHSAALPRFADRIAEAIYARVAAGRIDRLDAIFHTWRQGQGSRVERRRLFPLDLAAFERGAGATPPLAYLRPERLLAELTFAYVHAQLVSLALHAFAAENEARMDAMTRTLAEVDRKLAALRARQRIVRQEEITAEIVELAAGVEASRSRRDESRRIRGGAI